MNNFYIKCIKSKTIESGAMYGQFFIDSLHPGQGITIGNLMRRVLLGDLGGIAITAVRIAGIKHEFSVIRGVREDILEIFLNLKGVAVKGNLNESIMGQIQVKGPAVVTADSIELPAGLEIVNPNHYIATIADESSVLEMELQFEHGTGYKLANHTSLDNSDDFLQIDSIFMPVQKVDFKINNVYDKSNSTIEQLFFDIWTNGSISPEEAISSASQFIVDLFNSLMEGKSNEENTEIETAISNTAIDSWTDILIEELQLSVRPYNCLKKAQINTVGDLLAYPPEKLQELRNFGRKSADEVFTVLKDKLGIVLR